MVTVQLRVPYEMPFDPVCPGFQKSRPLTAAGAVYCLLRRGVYCEDILTVYCYAGDLIASGAL